LSPFHLDAIGGTCQSPPGLQGIKIWFLIWPAMIKTWTGFARTLNNKHNKGKTLPALLDCVDRGVCQVCICLPGETMCFPPATWHAVYTVYPINTASDDQLAMVIGGEWIQASFLGTSWHHLKDLPLEYENVSRVNARGQLAETLYHLYSKLYQSEMADIKDESREDDEPIDLLKALVMRVEAIHVKKSAAGEKRGAKKEGKKAAGKALGLANRKKIVEETVIKGRKPVKRLGK